MTPIEELTAWIESQYPLGLSTSCQWAVTGEEYVVVGEQEDGRSKVSGIIDEGKRRLVFADETSAIASARRAFERYSKNRNGVLYWRIKPEISTYDLEKVSPKVWWCGPVRSAVYMRLLISNRTPNRGELADK